VTTLFGYVPTQFKTSQKAMNLFAIYGAGLLVGAALIVILPEGMLVLYQSLAIEHQASTIAADSTGHAGHEGELVDPRATRYVGLSLIIGFSIMLLVD